jgi:hypothetical protein
MRDNAGNAAPSARPDAEIDGAESSWHYLPASSHADNATRRSCKKKGAGLPAMIGRQRPTAGSLSRRGNAQNGGVADSLDEAKAAFRAAGEAPFDDAAGRGRSASAFLRKSGRDMLSLSLSAHDPLRT